MKYQEKRKSLYGLVASLFLVVIQAFSPVAAQCPVLVGGSDFYDIAHSDTLWAGDLNLIETVGPEGSKFTSGIAFADSAQAFQDPTTTVYAVTTNPHLLDSTYVDVDQNMLVACIGAKDPEKYTNTKLISYKVGGIEKGSDFTIEFDLYGVNGTKYGIGKGAQSWDPYEVTVGIDLDQYGASASKVSKSYRVDPGTKTHVTMTGSLAAGLDYIKLDVIAGYNYVAGMAIGITNLRIKGCYKPHVTSSMGIEICAGEQALISLDKEYNAESYKWFSSSDGKTFKEVGSKKSLYEELKQTETTYYYYCLVNGVNSDTIKIKTITCCVDGEGNPMSRMDVFYDDFGYFDDWHTYTDAKGNTTTTPATWAPERANVTFDLSSTGMKFDPSGQINDDSYGVVVPSPTGYFQDISGNSRATWMNGVASDHSSLVTGKSGGGALFMNVTQNYSDIIFTRQIDGLCTDKNIFFETYIANMSGGFDPEVTINIKDAGTGKLLASDKKVATANSGWIRVHIDEMQVSSPSIVLEIVSTGTGDPNYWMKGNDLIIDDIRFMVCSPPSVDIYSNLESFASDTVICANTDFTMGSQVSELLTSFFKGEQKYLFQQSVDGNVWNNMGSISDKETYTFNTEEYPADTNYFRVVVANADALQKFIADPSNADYEDKCRNYSISKPFKIIRAGAIDMGKDMELSACGGTELEMNGSNDGTLVRWGWENGDGKVLVPTSADADAKTYIYKVTEDATFTFIGYNKDNCMGKRKFTVTKNSTVEFELDTVRECALTTVKAKVVPATAEFKWIYDGVELTETGSSVEFDTTFADATIKAVATAKGYCESDTVSLDVDIRRIPSEPRTIKTEASEPVKSNSTFPYVSMVKMSETMQWSKSEDGPWSNDAPSQPMDKPGVFPYYVRAVVDGCPSKPVLLTLTINETPAPEVRNDTVCVGTEIDFTKYITKSDDNFTLMWYNTEDGKGTANPSPYTATMGGMKLDYWVSQKSKQAESEKAHIEVIVANVAKPVVEAAEVVYCLNDEAKELTATVTEKPAIYSYANGMEWRVGDEVVANPVPATNVAGVTEYSVYGTFAHPTTLNGDAVCYSDPVTVTVTVAESPAPTSATSPEFTVSYVKTDGDATGSFTDIYTASSTKVAVTAGAGYTLVWYDADGNKLDAAPAPPYIADQDEDMTYTYQVSQVDENGCESEKVKVTVNVNGTPAPIVRDSVICSGKTFSLADKVVGGGPEFKLQWYTAKTGGTASDAAPALTETTPGVYTYYVSQLNTVTNAESRRVPISVTIVGVKEPKVLVAETTYCKGAEAASLNTVATTVSDEASYYMADAVLTWKNDGGVVLPATGLVPNTAVETSTSYSYFANQTYVIPSSGDVCEGEPVSVKVNVTVLDVPAGTYSVNYLKTDAADNGGKFKDLLAQNDQVAVAAAGCTLKWYGSDKSALTTVPTPAYDAALEGDAEYTYYVSQIDANGCESELVPVTVSISSSPMPTTEAVAYCEGETAAPLTATINTVGNGDAVSDYTLVWYSENPNNKATEAEKELLELTSAPVPATVVNNGETFQIYTYYVAQKRIKDGKSVVSRASALIDSVYARPQLVTANPDPVCEPATVDLSSSNLWSVKAAKVWAKAYGPTNASVDPTAIAVSGTYSTQAYFYVRGNQCVSDEKSIEVEVDYIRDLAIDGVSTTCPGTTVDLTATSTGISPNTVAYNWVSTEAGENETVSTEVFTTTALAGPASRTYNYTLTATAGACTVTAATRKTITIGDGPISGTVAFAEQDNTGSTTVPASNSGLVFYSCGNEVTVTADVVSTENDFVWTLNGAKVGEGATLNVTPTVGTSVYTLSYTNSCPTSFDVAIVSVPVVAVATNTPVNICEGEDFSAELNVSCAENTYKIAWFRDGVELTGETAKTLSYAPATAANNGVYSYTVTNRGCSVSGDVANGDPLKVRPYIQLTYQRSYVARRDSQLSIPLNISVPAGKDPSSIQWSEGGVNFGTGNPLSLNVTADHNFKVVLSDDDYCSAEAQIEVKVDARLKMKVSVDEQLCAGANGDLIIDTTGTGTFVYNAAGIVITQSNEEGVRTYTAGWKPGDDDRLHFEITPASSATYTVQFFYRQPSEGVDYQSVTIEKFVKVLPPVSIIAPKDLAVCGDGDASLDVELVEVVPSDVIVSWDDDPSIISGTDGKLITVAPVFDENEKWDYYTKVYNVRASYSICPEMVVPVKVLVNRPLTGEIVAPSVICEGAIATIDATSYRADEYMWNSTDDLSADSVKLATIYVKPEETSTYYLTMKRGMCQAIDEVTVAVAQKPEIVSVDSLSYNKRDVVVSGGATPYTYWLDDNAATASVNSTFEKVEYGNHMAYVIDASGCTASAMFVVKAPEFKIPKILSPNSDGVNDFFTTEVIREAYPNAVVKIFDRWGKLLATYKGEDQGWDGTYNGNPMMSTDYWYEIEIEELNKTYTGHFTLMRQ